MAGQNFILAHNKPLEFHRNVVESYVAPVVIKDNAWIAIGAILLPGVTIGEGSIVAAGSIVTKDIPPLVLAAGIPAKPLRDLAQKLKDQYSQKEFNTLLDRRRIMGYKGEK